MIGSRSVRFSVGAPGILRRVFVGAIFGAGDAAATTRCVAATIETAPLTSLSVPVLGRFSHEDLLFLSVFRVCCLGTRGKRN